LDVTFRVFGLLLVSMALVLGGSAPIVEAADEGVVKIGCSGTFGPGETGVCEVTFRATDEVTIEFGSSFARVTSALATAWRVDGMLLDGKDDPYHAWYGRADGSAAVGGPSVLVVSGTGGSGFLNEHGYAPPHPGTHTLRITASADFCLEAAVGLGCPFTASIKVRPGNLE
jgi:hypothetical protein